MSAEDTDGFWRRLHDSPSVANSKLVPQTSSHVGGCFKSTICLPLQRTALQMPGMKQEVHPLMKKMALTVCRLACSPIRHRDILKRQPLLSYSLGGKEPLSNKNTPPTSQDGLPIVFKNRLIQFLPPAVI